MQVQSLPAYLKVSNDGSNSSMIEGNASLREPLKKKK
jgi:hypothetical protein